jgi:hypothetical protein
MEKSTVDRSAKFCDVCGASEKDESIHREVFFNDEGKIIRIYDLCFHHWMEVYRNMFLEVFEKNDSKLAAFIKESVDEIIGNVLTRDKLHDLKIKEEPFISQEEKEEMLAELESDDVRII